MNSQSVMTVILGLLGIFIAWQQLQVQRNMISIEELKKNRDEVAYIIDLLGSDNVEKAELGGFLLVRMSNNNNLLKEIETEIKRYSSAIENEKIGGAFQSGFRNATAQNSPERKRLDQEIVNLSPIRLVFHVSNKVAHNQLQCVETIRRKLSDKSIQNRYIKFRETEIVPNVPSKSDLRTLKKSDSVSVKNKLLELLRDYIPDIIDRDKSSKYDHRKDVRTGTFEVWLSESFQCS